MSESRGPGQRHGRPEPPDPEDRSAAEAAALRILHGAAQSTDGMRRRLRRHGFSDEVAVEVTGKLVEGGWIDDRVLAESLGAKRREHGYGRRRVAADLAARGISDDETIAAALGGEDSEGELSAARDAARRLRRRYPVGRLAQADMHRFVAAMQRRGFNHDVIRSVVRDADIADQLGEQDSLGGD